MAIIVQKFGGTSVGNIERIGQVADLVISEYEKGNKVAVVVSAMAGVTDQLVGYAQGISPLQAFVDLQEYDAVLATGEQVSCALLSLALRARGYKARSWLGWQLPILTDGHFTNAKIKSIEVAPILESFDNGIIPIIAGFQGVHQDRITTFGRGGSDTTAAAISAALKASRCDIYTDVAGVFSADPRIVPNARKLAQLSYEEMLELASAGAKVLHSRSVEIAMKNNLKIQVLSSFSKEAGTMLTSEEELMEDHIVTGIACTGDEVCITLGALITGQYVTAQIFAVLAKAAVSVDMIVQNIWNKESMLSFTVAAADSELTTRILRDLEGKLFARMEVIPGVAKVSIVGVGIRRNVGAAQKMFAILAEQNIDIKAVSTSEIKVSVLVNKAQREIAVRALHIGFGLDV